ncbi:MAG TPA: family 10 glycosylhydrolase [Micromonosporaceae bacterium]
MIRHRRPFDPLALAAVISVSAVAVLISLVAVILVQRAPASEPAAAPGPSGMCGTVPTHEVRDLRGMTITTVRNTDWPSKPGLTEDQAKAEFIGWLDLAVAQHHNAIFVQVKPSGDAFFPTDYAPWSEWLTGNRDNVDPGWDPLAFMVSEAHKRNIQFHAWFMPYFGSSTEGAGGDISKLAPNHPLRQHPDWAVVYPANHSGSRLWYNPGIPEARTFIEDSILDVVSRYDIDGVFFDDYFYPYPTGGEKFNDAATYAKYGDGQSLADWRRSNVDALVRELGERVKQVKPWVTFGISPFGIWRNLSNDLENGSDTHGLSSYDEIYVDSRKWVREQWVDFIMPQLYWQIGNPPADYAKLVAWWSKQVEGTDVKLYIAHADDRIGESGAWSNPAEIDKQLTLDEKYPVSGSVHFTASDVRADRLGAVTRYRKDHYASLALPPVMAPLDSPPPAAPADLWSTVDSSGAVTLHWRPADGAMAYAVFRYGPSEKTAQLVGEVRATDPGELQWTDTPASPGPYGYCVSGLDRSWTEGATSSPTTVTA